eukprot:gene57536-biopygen35993
MSPLRVRPLASGVRCTHGGNGNDGNVPVTPHGHDHPEQGSSYAGSLIVVAAVSRVWDIAWSEQAEAAAAAAAHKEQWGWWKWWPKIRGGSSAGNPGRACVWRKAEGRVAAACDDGCVRWWERCTLLVCDAAAAAGGTTWLPDLSHSVIKQYILLYHQKHIRQPGTTRAACEREGHAGGAYAIDWHQQQRELFLTGGADRGVKVWDPVAGRCVGSREGHGGAVHGVAWSPRDGDAFASCGGGELRVWDLRQPAAAVAGSG